MIEQRKVILGEVVQDEPVEIKSRIDELGIEETLKRIHDELLDLINTVHMLNGPERLEMGNLVVETRRASGVDMAVPLSFFVGDIKCAANVLQERLKG